MPDVTGLPLAVRMPLLVRVREAVRARDAVGPEKPARMGLGPETVRPAEAARGFCEERECVACGM